MNAIHPLLLEVAIGCTVNCRLPPLIAMLIISILDDTYWGLIDVTIAFDAAISKYFEFGDEKVIW